MSITSRKPLGLVAVLLNAMVASALLLPLIWQPSVVVAADDALDDAKKELEKAFVAMDEPGMASAVASIADVGTDEAVRTLAMLEALEPRVAYEAVAKGLAAVKEESQLKVLAEVYKKSASRRRWTRQIMIIDAMADDVAGAGSDVFASAVKDRHPKVRLAAIRALASTKEPTKKHVDFLIESLRMSERLRDIGLPHIEAREGLAAMTAQKFKPHKAWAAWWAGVREEFEPKLDQKPVEVDANFDEQNLKYYDVPVISRRMVFIIDTSGSMSAAMKVTSSSPGGKTEKEGTRIERAKLELSELIKKLPSNTAFNVMAFETETKTWKKALVLRSQGNIASALGFTKGLKASGGTSAKKVLTEALKDNVSADTIYFLTDGAPSDGSPKEITDSVERLNRFMRIRVHTIGFGGGGQAFLSPLAKENVGKYQEIAGN